MTPEQSPAESACTMKCEWNTYIVLWPWNSRLSSYCSAIRPYCISWLTHIAIMWNTQDKNLHFLSVILSCPVTVDRHCKTRNIQSCHELFYSTVALTCMPFHFQGWVTWRKIYKPYDMKYVINQKLLNLILKNYSLLLTCSILLLT
jgi:hypothetical protein